MVVKTHINIIKGRIYRALYKDVDIKFLMLALAIMVAGMILGNYMLPSATSGGQALIDNLNLDDSSVAILNNYIFNILKCYVVMSSSIGLGVGILFTVLSLVAIARYEMKGYANQFYEKE